MISAAGDKSLAHWFSASPLMNSLTFRSLAIVAFYHPPLLRLCAPDCQIKRQVTEFLRFSLRGYEG